MKQPAAKTVAYMGILAAFALTLSYIESLFPAVAGMPPGIKLGLSNVVTMFCLFFVGTPFALVIVVLKAGFAFLIRGYTAGLLSFCGGAVALTAMVPLLLLTKKRASVGFLSIVGAVAHNMGQITAAFVLLGSGAVFFYTPILLLSGVAMGAVTGVVCRIVLPHIARFGGFGAKNGDNI